MNPAQSFGSVADMYDRARPSYPAPAVQWITGMTPCRVLDVGAGTGKLTAVVRSLGHDTVAVEPDDAMRALLKPKLPDVMTLPGSAESIPLPDNSVDAVVAGQAYHWFERPTAIPEIARVLKPGGVLGLLWNVRNENEPWVAELTRVLRAGGDAHPNQHPAPEGDEPWFSPYERSEWAHDVPCSQTALLELITSRSYVLTATPAQRTSVETALNRLMTEHRSLRGRTTFPLPYVTHTYRAVVTFRR